MLTITVSQLNRYVKAVLEEDPRLREVYVKGEIAGLVRHRTSGHCYFKLADEGGSVKAVMFSRHAQLLEFEPADGMAVLARASVGVYERDGVYQLYVTEMMPDGAGALAVALAQRKERLAAQGVFDPANKKPLPAFPRRIGVVTSKSGAALQDIRTVIERRWPLCTLVLCSAQVQGSKAPVSLKRALETLDRAGCDVLLLARGGGSAEELWSFNDEELVLAVHRCRTPVISAVGHEIDYTLCDYAADARAPTPSAAAELAVPDRQELLRRIGELEDNLWKLANNQLSLRRQMVARMASHPALRSPGAVVERYKEKVDICHKALYNSKRILIQRLENRMARGAGLLDSLSPLRVLDRGYCIVLQEDAPVIRAKSLQVGDALELRFLDGSAKAAVTQAAGEENK
ncbi:MAG: exodeoxyribonuclease VII large subunit [Oscillospiraceae bacterium]